MTIDYLVNFDRIVMKKCEEYRKTETATLNNIALGRVERSLGGYVAQQPITVKDLTALLKSRNQYDDVKRRAATNGYSVGHYLEEATKALNNNFVTLANLNNAPNMLAALSSAVSSSSSSSASSVSSFSYPYSDNETDNFQPNVLLSPLQKILLKDNISTGQVSQHSNQPSTSYDTYEPFRPQYSSPPRPGHLGSDLTNQGRRGRPVELGLPHDIQNMIRRHDSSEF